MILLYKEAFFMNKIIGLKILNRVDVILQYIGCDERILVKAPLKVLQFLAKPRYSSEFYENFLSSNLKPEFKIGWPVRIRARRLLEIRGYKLNGETWEHV